MNLVDAGRNLDVDGWLRGLFSAGISGGASAVVGGFTVSGMDPKDYNFAQAKFYILVGALFATNAVVSIAKFLAAQPLPTMKTVATTTQITEQANKPPIVVTRTTETHVEPIAPAAPKP
jgi:hypothetical protein